MIFRWRWVVGDGWMDHREEFGVADGGGGRFVGEGLASPTAEWLTEDER